MKAIKFVILAAGLLGLISAFLPLASFEYEQQKVAVSAFDVIKGVEMAEKFKSSVEKDVAAQLRSLGFTAASRPATEMLKGSE